jgi:hypothetical protein
MDGVLSRIPGLAGVLASQESRAAKEQRDLARTTGVLGLMNTIRAQEDSERARAERETVNGILMQSGGNVEAAIPALLGAGAAGIPAATQLGALSRSMRPERVPDTRPEILKLTETLGTLPADDPTRASIEGRIRFLNEGRPPAPVRPPAKANDLQLYEEAVKQGFKGTILDFKRQIAAAGRAPAAAPAIQPLVQIMGDDGQPTLVERRDAVGRVPAGAGSRAEATMAGKADVDKDIMTLKGVVDELRDGGGMTDPSQNTLSNVMARTGSSGLGQTVGSFVGTKNQSARDKMNMIRPSLLRSIMQSTGMSARQMDSNAELKLWLSTATDPTVSYDANIAALNQIAEKYGSGGFLQNEGAAPAAPKAAAEARLQPNQVKLPNGTVKTFPSAAAAANFRKAAKLP